ncbi:MAG: MoaD/ThiS family protein [Gammaproteobacteria bacterium]
MRLRFFARYAELLGREEAMLDVPLPATVADVVRQVRDEIPGGEQLPERPMAALNFKHVHLDAAVGDGDEVAFLPPLAGG